MILNSFIIRQTIEQVTVSISRDDLSRQIEQLSKQTRCKRVSDKFELNYMKVLSRFL